MDEMLNLSEKGSTSVTAQQQTKNKCWDISFQTGLVRKSVKINLDSNGELSLENFRRAACAFVDENFPEHGFYNLTDKILLFRHDLSDSNILKLIRNVSDLVEKALIEVVLSADVVIEDLNIKPHNLHSHTYKSPHFCDFCGEMLFGLIKQGLRCDGCHMNFHKRCSNKIPNNCNNSKLQQHSSGSSDQEVMETDENQTTLAKTTSTSAKSSFRSRKNRSKPWNGRPLWMEKEYASRIKVPHTFAAHTYTRPTVCQHCKKLLKGFIRQGMQCKNCKLNCHARCTSLTPVNCPGEIQQIQAPVPQESGEQIQKEPTVERESSRKMEPTSSAPDEKQVKVDVINENSDEMVM